MPILKPSFYRAKSGKRPDRQKGLAYYTSLLTLFNGDKEMTKKISAIIKWLEQKVKDEKK